MAAGTIGTTSAAARAIPQAALAMPAHHAIGGRQPEGAAPGEADRRHLRHEIVRLQQVGLARAGRAAAHVNRADSPGAGTKLQCSLSLHRDPNSARL